MFFFTWGMITGVEGLGPRVEALIHPVLTKQSVVFAQRGPRYACAVWKFTKMWDAKPLTIDFDILKVRNGSFASDTTALIPVDGGGFRTLRASNVVKEPGDNSRVLCFDLTHSGIPDDRAVLIRGVITYEGFAGLWPLRVRLPVIEFGARG